MPPWDDPVKLAVASDPQEPGFGSADIGVGAAGNAVAVWTWGSILETSRTQAAITSWSAPAELAEAENASVAVDAQGDAVAAWERRGGLRGPAIEAAFRPARLGHWKAPALLSPGWLPLGAAEGPQVAIGANGDAVAVWGREDEASNTHIVEAVVGSARTGRWRAPTVLSAPGAAAEAPQAAIDARGDAVAVWDLVETSGRAIPEGRFVQAAARPANATAWSAPVNVSSGPQAVSDLRVAIDSKAHAVAVWRREPLTSAGQPAVPVVDAAAGNVTSGSWRAPVELSAPTGLPASDPEVAADSAGRDIVVWESNAAMSNRVIAVIRSGAAGSWKTPRTLASWDHEQQPQPPPCSDGACARAPFRPLPRAHPRVALNASGDAVAVWERAGAYAGLIEADLRPARKQKWNSPQRLSPVGGFDAQVALGASGQAFAIWLRHTPCVTPYIAASCVEDNAVEATFSRPLRR
jgi:hypothetical protein